MRVGPLDRVRVSRVNSNNFLGNTLFLKTNSRNAMGTDHALTLFGTFCRPGQHKQGQILLHREVQKAWVTR